MPRRPVIAFFGSSLLSAYWNGAATYYLGIIRALNDLGYQVTFYEPDIYDRGRNRDMEEPDWARVVIYQAKSTADVDKALEMARGADVIVKASGVGAFDEYLERAVLRYKNAGATVIFWDVDAPATLDRLDNNPDDPFWTCIPEYDYIFTYGGGKNVVDAYMSKGANDCVPIYNALDPQTHHPVNPDPTFAAELSFLGNRLPDREARVEQFFLLTASKCTDKNFLLGGSGWQDKAMPANVHYLGHVFTHQHNAFNCTPLAVLNISRDSMASYGFSPATRLFEAAGAGACIITDEWEGIDSFLEPGSEILVAKNSDEVAAHLNALTRHRSREIGAAARKRVLAEHTYTHRARFVDKILELEKTADVLQSIQ